MQDAVTVKLPNALTVSEMVAKGMTPEAAKHKMNEYVFGVGYKKDDNGKPIENGLGSPLNPTSQHLEALRIATERKAQHSGGLNMESIAAIVAMALKASQGTQVVTPELIAQAVAAGVMAGLAKGAENAKAAVAVEETPEQL